MEEEEWTLHSKARLVYLDGELESPCATKAKMNIFPMNESHPHSFCMDHCRKLGGCSPSVRTEMEWKNLLKEVKAVSPDPSRLSGKIWLSATEGDIGLKLGELDHWPEGIIAEEGVWRVGVEQRLHRQSFRDWENQFLVIEIYVYALCT